MRLLTVSSLMKVLMFVAFFSSSLAVACDEEKFKDLTREDKFLEAVEQAEFAYFGKVVRLYRLPDTPKKVPGFNGFVFEVDKLIKGETLNYMDAGMSPTCGINDEYMEGYWPTEIGDKFVVAGYEKDGLHYITAVFPLEEALNNIYRVMDIRDVPAEQ